MTTSARSTRCFLRADVVIGPYILNSKQFDKSEFQEDFRYKKRKNRIFHIFNTPYYYY